LSHGHVTTEADPSHAKKRDQPWTLQFGDDDRWEFTDEDKNKNERVRIGLSWHDFGRICNAAMFGYQKIIYSD